jgi:flagellar biosynthetic protein FlhB
MADQASDGGQEKTEQPTQKRLEKSKEDGEVPSSKELFVFSTLLTGFFLYIGIMPFISSIIFEWSSLFKFSGEASLLDYVFNNLKAGYALMYWKSVLFALPLFVIVILTQMTMSGVINWSSSALNLKASRINPFSGLKRMFSMKALVEMLKAIGKVVFLLGAAVFVMFTQMDKLLTAPATHLVGGISRLGDVFLFLIIAFLLVLAVMAMLDVSWQFYQHNKKLKMTLQEIKDESKQTDGSPEVKAKIRRMQMTAGSRAKQRREAMENVPSATAIITNPTHFAVALKYEVGTAGAPIILAMGRGYQAQEIISIGKDAGVTVFQNELLARALFFAGQIGEEIPTPLFTAVAAILGFIYRLNKGDAVDEPDVELPADMLFDENGKSIS